MMVIGGRLREENRTGAARLAGAAHGPCHEERVRI